MATEKDWTGNYGSIIRCLGAHNLTDEPREVNDFYATEPKAAEWLIKIEELNRNIWECACGQGHLSKVFEANGFNVKSSDLIDRGFGQGGVDFLKCTDKYNGDIVTNPPYKYAQEFVEHALELVEDGHKVCMFLKVQFLEGKRRRALFEAAPPPNRLGFKQQNGLREKRNLQIVGGCIRLVRMEKRVQRRNKNKMVQLKTTGKKEGEKTSCGTN